MGILARTELESIDALRTTRADPERIVRCIDGIVKQGMEDMRFQSHEADADVDVAMRLAEALLGTNLHGFFARAVRVLERVRETVKSEPDAARSALWHEFMTSALMLCGRPDKAMGVAVAGVCAHKDNVVLLYLLGILRAGAGQSSEAADVFERALKLRPEDPVLLHAQGALQEGASLERILLTRPLWTDGIEDLDRTEPESPLRTLRMAAVGLRPDGYRDALISLDIAALEPDEQGFLTMTAKLGENDVPFVFEMNDAGFSKMEPAWLARLVSSVLDVTAHAQMPPELIEEVRVRVDRRVRVEFLKLLPTQSPSALEYSYEVPVRCPRIERGPAASPELAAVMKHLRALDLRCDDAGIIKRIKQMSREQVTRFYAFELARAFANCHESTKQDYETGLKIMRDLGKWALSRYEPLFCYATLAFKLGRMMEAQHLFKACLARRPDDQTIGPLLEICRRKLPVPVFDKCFRARIPEVWAAIEAEAPSLEETLMRPDGAEDVRRRLETLMAPVSSTWWHLDVTPHNGRVLLEISPHGWRLECYPLLEFVRRMPESLKSRWIVATGRSARPDDVMYETFRAGNALLTAEGVHIWPEPSNGMWHLKVYVEGYNSAMERGTYDCFHAVRTLLDRALGEAVRLRWCDAITLLDKAPPGEGLTLLEMRDFLSEKVPGCFDMTLEAYTRMPHEYGLSPNRNPQAPLLADVTEGLTRCPPLGHLYGEGKPVGMDALASVGATAGFFFFDVAQQKDGASKNARRAEVREALQAHIEKAFGRDYVEFVGYASGLRFEYLQFFAWDIGTVVGCATKWLKDRDDVIVAGFHTYLHDAEHALIKLDEEAESAVAAQEEQIASCEDANDYQDIDFENDPRMTAPAMA